MAESRPIVTVGITLNRRGGYPQADQKQNPLHNPYQVDHKGRRIKPTTTSNAGR